MLLFIELFLLFERSLSATRDCTRANERRQRPDRRDNAALTRARRKRARRRIHAECPHARHASVSRLCFRSTDLRFTRSSHRANMPARMIHVRPEGRFHPRMRKQDMTPPTQDQNKNPQQDQNQAQGRKDDMHNTGAQAKKNETTGKDADRDVQQRKDAPKPGQDH
jgi:hypothetical protein